MSDESITLIKYSTGYVFRAKEKGPIYRVEAERQTNKSVWINGRRNNRQPDYHDSWEDARDYLLEEAHKKVAAAESRFQRLCKDRTKIEALENPEQVADKQ